MNDDDGPDLQRLFASYEPAITAQPFLDQTLASLHREMRRARVRSTVIYVLTAVVVMGVVAATAAPLTGLMHGLEEGLKAFAGALSPVKSQALIYVATLGLVILARRRLGAFLAPW